MGGGWKTLAGKVGRGVLTAPSWNREHGWNLREPQPGAGCLGVGGYGPAGRAAGPSCRRRTRTPFGEGAESGRVRSVSFTLGA